MSSKVINRNVSILKVQLQSVQRRKEHGDGNRTFLHIVLFVSSVIDILQKVPSRVMCEPVLDSTRCGFFNLRWEVKEVVTEGCFACLFFESQQRKYLQLSAPLRIWNALEG